MANCATCLFEVEAGRSHCPACDTPMVGSDPTAVLPPGGWSPLPQVPMAAPAWSPPPATGPAPPSGYPGYAAPFNGPPPGYGQPAAGPAWGASPYGAPPPGYPPAYAVPYAAYPAVAPAKSKGTAAVLCFFFGFLGVHRFYTGQTGIGVALLLTTLFLSWTVIWIPIAFVWILIDFIMILSGGVKDQYGRPLV